MEGLLPGPGLEYLRVNRAFRARHIMLDRRLEKEVRECLKGYF